MGSLYLFLPGGHFQLPGGEAIRIILVLASEKPDVQGAMPLSTMTDEDMMKPGHWLASVLCVFFSALTLLVG